ncbi:endonuclease domain-containing protein [Azospirillum sp. INR13]|uniref:endonuclease domain-containing protein n=1 Tax=Azospirillum sp. INR13 TaxID=2596919 RepID=UPI002105D690|nr:DUF559 domain-containing protein [Azospirillum sp. INR13]
MEVCLAVEVDGGQHADSGYDEARTKFLMECGWRVLRFWNTDVLRNPEGVAASVLEALGGPRNADTCPHPNPPPLGGGGD